MAGIRSIIDPKNNPATTSLSVSQLNIWMKNCIEGAAKNVRVYGEVSNLSRPRSGHVYFTLKDQDAEITCVMFRTYTNQFPIDNILYHGAAVELEGQVTLYAARGQYQLVAVKAHLYGEGKLRQQYLLLEKQLSQEGLFDPTQKRSLPKYPMQIGVISSPSAAGFIDFIKMMRLRFPICSLRLYPALVQGKQAAQSLCLAMHKASQAKDLDAIVLCRGGGSLEDLWCFNDPDLARAIFSCAIPTVNAVGHEIDHTIADKVVDVRAATPTQAAVLLTPNHAELYQHLQQYCDRAIHLTRHLLSHKSWSLHHLHQSLTHPKEKVEQQYKNLRVLQSTMRTHILHIMRKHAQEITRLQSHLTIRRLVAMVTLTNTRLQHLSSRMHRCSIAMVQAHFERLEFMRDKLDTVNPHHVLQRGYVIAQKDGKVLDSSNNLQIGDRVRMIFHDGVRELIVEK